MTARSSGNPEKPVSMLGPWLVSVSFHAGVAALSLMFLWMALEAAEPPDFAVASARTGSGGSPTASEIIALGGASRDVLQEAVFPARRVYDAQITPAVEDLWGPLFSGDFPKEKPVTETRHSPAPPLQPSFGVTSGWGSGISAGFFSACGFREKPEDRILYLIDASGSLVEGMPVVIRELRRALGQLKPSQQFQILFFQNGEPLEVPVPSRGWKPATPQAIEAASRWVEPASGHAVARGVTDPSAAVRQGLALKPDTVYLLSDNITGRGRYEVHQQDLLALFAPLPGVANPPMVHTIQFLNPDPLNSMAEIARCTGGRFQAVLAADVGLIREYTVPPLP